MSFFLIPFVLAFAIIILTVTIISKNKKAKKLFLKIKKSDNRFTGSKLFNFIDSSFILISESGFIALKSLTMKEPRIMNINEIYSFEVITDGKPFLNLGNAIIGGFLFVGVGAVIGGMQSREMITMMSFLFKTSDFNIPNIEIPVIDTSLKKGSFEYRGIMSKITDVMGTLELVEKRCRAA